MKTQTILLLLVVVMLFVSTISLSRMTITLEKIYDERTLRVTEIVNKNYNEYDVSSYGTVVLPDNGLIKY